MTIRSPRFCRYSFPVRAFQLTPHVYDRPELWPDWLRRHYGTKTRDKLMRTERGVILAAPEPFNSCEVDKGDWVTDPGLPEPFEIWDDSDFRAKFTPLDEYVNFLRQSDSSANLERDQASAEQAYSNAKADLDNAQAQKDTAYDALNSARRAINRTPPDDQ